MGKFPFSFRSKVSGDSRLDLALASNFDKAATEDYVDAAVAAGGGGGGVSDHGALTGLSDDDHTQYHNDSRGDARYWQLSTDLATQAELDAHTGDTTAAHAASAISYAGGTGIAATDVEAAIDELATEKANLDSPTFTGTPSLPTAATAVTQAEGDNDTSIATTAFVQTATGSASSNRPACKLYGPTPTSCGDATNTPITAWSSESFDTDNMHSAVTNTGRITINTPGTYIVHARAYFTSDTAANTAAYTTILVNGTTAYYLSTMPVRTIVAGIDNIFDQVEILQLAAGDYLEMHVYQDNAAGTAESLQSGATQTTFSAAWVGGTGAAWGNAGCRVYSSSATSIPNTGAPTAVTFNSETFDTDGMHSTSSNTDRITCVTPGTYLVTGQIQFASSTAAGIRGALIYKNGASVGQTQIDAGDSGAIDHSLNVSALVQMVAGDYVQLMGQNTAAGALNTTTGEATHFSAVRVGYQTNPADLPGTYVASMYAANSGSPTHTSNGGWQKVGSGGGTLTWTSEIDKRPSGVSAQVDTATNKRIDIRKTGLYRVGYSVGFSALADGKTFSPAVYKNGALIIEHNQRAGSAGTPISNGSRIVSLTSGDYLELYAWQDDSASEAYYVANSSDTFLQAEYLGPAT